MPLLSIQDTKFVWREVNLNVTAWSMFAIENWFTKLQRDSKRVTALVSPISSHSITCDKQWILHDVGNLRS